MKPCPVQHVVTLMNTTNIPLMSWTDRKQWQPILRTNIRKQSEKLGTEPILSELCWKGYKRGSMVAN
jgi:hypothetical protein